MKYQSGQVVQGIVTGIKPYGAFVKIDDNTDGLIHISEISDNYVNHSCRSGQRTAETVSQGGSAAKEEPHALPQP